MTQMENLEPNSENEFSLHFESRFSIWKQNNLIDPLDHNITKFRFCIFIDAINHIYKEHGTQSKDYKKAIINDDYAYLPEIINNPDTVTHGNEKNKNKFKKDNCPRLVFRKRLEGKTYEAVIKIHVKKQFISLVTFYRM